MSCNKDMAAYSNNKVPFPQDPEPASDAFATTKASLEGESGVGEVTSLLKNTEHPSFGDGDQGQYPPTNCSNTCGPSADDYFGSEAISDTLPSEASPTKFGGCLGNSMDMILSSHSPNTVANLGDGLQSKHVRSFPSTSSNSPWGSDSPWSTYKIPEEFDNQGRVTAWTEVTIQKVKPYIPEGQQGQSGGSGLLDTKDPTLHYLTMPIESLDTTRFVPLEVEEMRRLYRQAKANPIIRGPNDHTGVTDDEDSSSDGNDNQEEQEEIVPANDINTGASEAAAVPFLTYGGPSNPVLRDVRESCPSQEDEKIDMIFVPGCRDETGSVMSSMSSIEDEPVTADEQAPNVHANSQDERVSEVEDMQAHNIRRRVLVTTTDGGTVCIDLPQVIVISFPGMPTKKLHFSIANLSKTCWDIIKDHGIASVNAISAKKRTDENPTSSLLPAVTRMPYVEITSSSPVFDNAWIQKNATLAMKEDFPDFDYYEAIQAKCDRSPIALRPEMVPFYYENFNHLVAHYLLNKPLAPPNGTLEEQMANGKIVLVDELNFTVPQFIKRLFIDAEYSREQHRRFREIYGPSIPFERSVEIVQDTAAMVDDWPVQERVFVPQTFDHENENFDLQQFNWLENVGLTDRMVRAHRDREYFDYRNTHAEITHGYPSLDETTNLAQFVPKAMYTKYKASAPHMQLRNLMACKGYNAVVYASDRGADKSKVFHYFPFHDMRDCIIDLSETSNETVYPDPVRISTLALSTGDYYRGICMVGGFDGEYAVKNMLHDTEDQPVVVGHATRASYGIVNHIDIDYFAYDAYRAVLACNDNKVRILDVETNTFLSNPGSNTNTALKSGQLSGHQYPFAVNCTSMCPDGKLRVVVGDTTDVVVVDAESGRSEKVLQGHEDYGFAVAWSPDGRYIASANQDRLVNIWDARTWRVVTRFTAQNAGYRSMRWSPVGGGSKCLVLAEPADRICVVNATTFDQMQTHEFYGEIVGMDFHGDGTGLWVANADEKFGGMMEYERRGYEEQFGWGFMEKDAVEEAGDVYREQGPNEWVWETERGEDPRVVDPTRTGPLGAMGLL